MLSPIRRSRADRDRMLATLAPVLLATAAAFGSPAVATAARHATLVFANANRRRNAGTRPSHNLKATPLDWEKKARENGWEQAQYGKRFERMFKVSYAEFKELTARITHRRAEHLAKEREGKNGWWNRLTRAGVPVKKPGHAKEGCVSVELGLAMTLRYLAGGSLWDIMLWANVLSTRTFYKHVRQTLRDLDGELPEPTLPADLKNPARLEALAAGFEKRSYGWIKGAVGALDGLLLPRSPHLRVRKGT